MAGALDGATLSLAWAIPFASLLLCISLMPLFVPHFWHHHYNLVAYFHVLVLLVPLFIIEGASVVLTEVLAAMMHEYIP